MTVTVYTKPSCVQCDATKRKLESADIEYESIDLTKSEDAMQAVKELGYLQAPVVVAEFDGKPTEHWSGYRPDKIESLVA